MPDRSPIESTNLDIYGSPVLPWSRAHDLLTADPAERADAPQEEISYLSTVRPDGRPHTVGIGAMWYDGDIYIVIGPDSRKARNLAANPACTVAMRLASLDLVVEGDAARVTDAATLEALAARFRTGGWPAQVEGDAITAPFSAPSAGPAPWHLYRIRFHTAFGVATEEPSGATRWRFGD